MPIWGVI